jgi:hypothetical protein
MGKWLERLRENGKRARDVTDKTDKTTPGEEGRGFVSFVGPRSEHFRNFRPFYGGPEWDEEDWEAAFDERAAILEFDQGMSREDAEALAWRQIETERRKWLN